MTRFRWFHLENGEVRTNLVKNRVGCYYILGVILGFLGFFETERSVWTMMILSF